MLATTGTGMYTTRMEGAEEMETKPMDDMNGMEDMTMDNMADMETPSMDNSNKMEDMPMDSMSEMNSMSKCSSGPAKYMVTFYNGLARDASCVYFENRAPPKSICTTRFEAMNVHKTRCCTSYLPVVANCHADIIPEDGLVFSPMTVVTHSPRISLFTLRGYASPPVEEVCETGNNTNLLAAARGAGYLTTSVMGGMGPVVPNGNYSVEVAVTCDNSYLTAISMIAPSPDWIVQLANIPMLNAYGNYIEERSGPLVAYDCGTDSGKEFTAPPDTSLDIPTESAMNIAPLFIDETDPFGRKSVGWYSVKRIM